MNQSSYVPDDAEKITEYGAVEGTDSISAAEQNCEAIARAAERSGSNNVYIPSGNWYVGHRSAYDFLSFGRGSVDRGPAGTSLYGAGPEQSFMTVASDVPDDVGLQIRYHADQNDHGSVDWRGLTYDGNYEAINIDPDRGNQRGIVIDAPGDFTFENVRIRRTYAAAVRLAVDGGTYSFNRCTLRDAGIGRHNGTGRGSVDHFIAGRFPNSTLSITNSVFEGTSGTVVDFDGTGTTTKVENCWCKGIGSAMFKVNDTGSCLVSNLYFQGESAELSDKLNSSGPAQGEFHGRWFLYRLDGDKNNTPEFELNDVLARDLPYEAFYIRDRVSDGANLDVTVRGGTDGPIAIENASTLSGRPSGLRDRDGSSLTNMDIDQLSVHNTNGTVFDTPNGNGVIRSLNRGGNNGIGDTGGIDIDVDNPGSDPFSPNVPARSDVGINSHFEGTTDSGPSVSWAAPTGGETLTDTVALQVNASDDNDDAGSLTVEYSVDGGAWSSMSYNSSNGSYEAAWDTTSVADGEHTLQTRAIDSAGNHTTAAINVFVAGAPVFEDWTPRWSSVHSDWGLVSGTGFTGEHAFAFENGDGNKARYAASYDPAGKPADVEVLDKFRVPSFAEGSESGFHARVYLRSSVRNGNEDGYWIEVEDRADAFRLGKYTGGNVTTLQRFGAPAEDTFFYRRFRAEGDQIKAKIWQAGEDEPPDWDVTLSDSDHSDGWVGLGSYDAHHVETDVFSVATGDASASLESLTDSGPSVSWAAPTGGETLTDTVALQVNASDDNDDAGSLTVEYSVDGGAWSSMSYNSSNGSYEAAWDTTSVADGEHTLQTRAIDSADQTDTATVTVTVESSTQETDSSSPDETESSSAAPVIEQIDVTEQSDSDWTRFEIDWSVSDADADLDMVISSLRCEGTTVAAESTRVYGDSASYSHVLRDRGDIDEIQLTVNDTENQTASESWSV